MWCLLRRIVLILLEFRAVHGGWFGSVIPSVEGWEGRPGGAVELVMPMMATLVPQQWALEPQWAWTVRREVGLCQWRSVDQVVRLAGKLRRVAVARLPDGVPRQSGGE